MKARIRYVTCPEDEIKEFNTLEDLIKWKTEIDSNIIIEKKLPWFDDKEYDLYIQVEDYKTLSFMNYEIKKMLNQKR